jgi:ABC-type nickel/cobalt efflux system permease component RcnA
VSDRKSTLALNPGPFLERDASRAQPKKEGSLNVWSEKNFKSLMKRDVLSIFSLVIALILAFVYGMTHAISPGHGKTMVAAYLVGSRGRILDAVFLGMVVTLTHTGSVLLLGAIVLWLQEYIMPETLTPFLQIISGIIIFLLGIWLFMSRVLLKKHALPNAHRHEHHHRDGILSHNHVEREISDEIKKNVSWWELLLLGMSGGIVPCPAALVVLLAAMVTKKLVFGMALILSFSAGLAVVLIFIGVFMVMAKNLLNGFERFDSFSRVMPAISSIGVIVIGVFIIFQALVQGGFLG